MTLNTEKSEVAFLTSSLHEARWQQTIHLEGQPLRFPPLLKLLAVILDRALSFGQHIAIITTKAGGRCRVLTSLTSKQWVWRKNQLTKIYKALYLSVLMYGAPAYNPFETAGTLSKPSTSCDNRSASDDPSGDAEASCRSVQHDGLDAPTDRQRLGESR